MIVDNRSDASHEGQTCRHVQVKMEGLAEPANEHKIEEEKAQIKHNITDTIIKHYWVNALNWHVPQ